MFRPGDVIGPYVLLRTLGRGAYGEVWLAERRASLLTIQVALWFRVSPRAGSWQWVCALTMERAIQPPMEEPANV